MSCRTPILAAVLLLPALVPPSPGPRAETLEMRVYRVETGLDPGDGTGTPPADYYLDGGVADGVTAGALLPVFRELAVAGVRAGRTHTLRVHVGELEVLHVYADTAIARVAGIRPATEAPEFEPRAVMIGDYVPHAMLPPGGSGTTASTAGMAGAPGPTLTGAPGDPTQPSPGVHGTVMPEQVIGGLSTGRAVLAGETWSLPAAPEAFLPGFPSADKWYPLPPPVLFDLGSADLDLPAQDDLEGVALVLLRNPERLLSLVGRTCDLGSEAYNRALSLRRARTVAAFLQSRGVENDRLSVTALGESAPVRPNSTDADRRHNRRVDLSLGSVGPVPEPEIPLPGTDRSYSDLP